jgi:DNA-binding CsgD family transcriptional regulator
MELSESTSLRLVERIYETATEPALWPTLLGELRDAVGADSASVTMDHLRDRSASVLHAVGLEEGFIRDFNTTWAPHNPWITRGMHLPEAQVILGEELVSASEMRKTPFYNDLLRRADAFHLLGAMLVKQQDLIGNISVLRGERRAPFGECDRDLLELLTPHLIRSVTIQRRLGIQQDFVASTEQLRVAVVVLDGTGRIIYENPAGRGLLDENDGLRRSREGLTVDNWRERNLLRAQVNAATRLGSTAILTVGGVLNVSRPSGQPPLSVVVSPIAPSFAFPEAGVPAALVWISDPSRAIALDAAVLKEAFDFTPTETRVAELFVAGKTLRVIADELGVELTTIRTHVQRLMAKTDTHRQPDLMRVLLTGPGAFSSRCADQG